MISITKIDKQVKYCRGDSYPKRSCSMRKSGKDKGCLPPGNPPASCDPGTSPVADQCRPVSGPQVQESMCLVGHFLSQREHGEVWRAVESKMSAADRVVPPEGSFWDKHAYLNPAPDRRQRYRLPHSYEETPVKSRNPKFCPFVRLARPSLRPDLSAC